MAKFRLPTLRINGKILAIAATTLVGMALIGAIYLTQRAQIDILTAQERSATQKFETLANASKMTEAVRRVVGELVLAPSAETVTSVEAAAADIEDNAAAYAEQPDIQFVFQGLPGQATGVVERSIALGLDEDSGLKGALRVAVHNVEALLDAEASSGTALDAQLVQMLMLRRHEKDFMLRKSDKYVVKFDEQITSKFRTR